MVKICQISNFQILILYQKNLALSREKLILKVYGPKNSTFVQVFMGGQLEE